MVNSGPTLPIKTNHLAQNICNCIAINSQRSSFLEIHTSREHYNIYFLKFFIHKLDASLQITVHGQNYAYNEKKKEK